MAKQHGIDRRNATEECCIGKPAMPDLAKGTELVRLIAFRHADHMGTLSEDKGKREMLALYDRIADVSDAAISANRDRADMAFMGWRHISVFGQQRD